MSQGIEGFIWLLTEWILNFIEQLTESKSATEFLKVAN